MTNQICKKGYRVEVHDVSMHSKEYRAVKKVQNDSSGEFGANIHILSSVG